MIGFKISKRTGQMFLTFKPPIVYSYTLGGKPYNPKSGQFINATIGEYADYGDFLTFSDMSFGNIDPVVESAADAMGKQAVQTLNQILGKLPEGSVEAANAAIKEVLSKPNKGWDWPMKSKPFLIYPQILKDIQADPTFEGLLS